MESLRAQLVKELAGAEEEEAEVTARGELVHAADLRKAIDAIRDRLFRMGEEEVEDE